MKNVIVISGGSDGLGKAIARKLTGDASMVVIMSPHKEKLRTTAQELGCAYEIGDVTAYPSVQRAVRNILKKYKRIDYLINCAGVWAQGNLEDHSLRDIKKTIEVNTLGTIYLTKAVIPFMKKRRSGTIVNIISQAGLYAKPNMSVYFASKWAITGFTKSIQAELAEHNIRVTGVYPGKLNTRLFQKAGIEKNMRNAIDPEEVAKAVQFILQFDDTIVVPEFGIKHIHN
ncbi:MAG: SDR family oxidoreductase [Patescibacteria group bacterium]